MKKGKTAKLQGFKTIKALYGTVDSKNFKSIYINIQSWVEPKIELSQNWERTISNFLRQIKQTINDHLNRDFFEDKFIVDLDLRSSGILYGKKSFLNLEITLFVKLKVDFKSQILKLNVKNLCQIIFMENFRSNKYFDFYISKKEKVFV